MTEAIPRLKRNGTRNVARILSIVFNPSVDISCDAESVQHTMKVRTHNLKQYPGGGGTNVARVVAELGGHAELLYLSGGAVGSMFEKLLAAGSLTGHRFPIADETRISLAVREEQTRREYRFVPEGPVVTTAELQPALDFIADYGADYIVASGSLPRNAPADTYARIAAIASRTGARYILDTSRQALKSAVERGGIFVLKPNVGELESIEGTKLDEEGATRAALAIVRRGAAEHVVVTFGREGALLASAGGVLRVPARHVETVSAVGAGDSFVGAMTWSLAEGHSVEEAFRFGVAAGAAAAMTPGSELCRRADVFALYEAGSRTIN